MIKQGNNYYIGTSGWAYEDWLGRFYPENLPSEKRLGYFSRFFKTAEINYSFYHLPRQTTYYKWFQETPSDFIFSVKVSRFITHIKRLREVDSSWSLFLKNALALKNKLGPFLFQFPASFKKDKKRIEKLEDFLKLLRKSRNREKKILLRFAFEFRDKSWFEDETYGLLQKYGAGWVIADSSRYPRANITTSDFAYFRFHGPTSLFSSKYSRRQLSEEASLIVKYLRKKMDVFCYFNNDFQAFAIENAKELVEIIKEEK